MNIIGNYEPAELNLKAGFLAFVGGLGLFLIIPFLCFLLLPTSLHSLTPILLLLIPITVIVKVIIMN